MSSLPIHFLSVLFDADISFKIGISTQYYRSGISSLIEVKNVVVDFRLYTQEPNTESLHIAPHTTWGICGQLGILCCTYYFRFYSVSRCIVVNTSVLINVIVWTRFNHVKLNCLHFKMDIVFWSQQEAIGYWVLELAHIAILKFAQVNATIFMQLWHPIMKHVTQ